MLLNEEAMRSRIELFEDGNNIARRNSRMQRSYICLQVTTNGRSAEKGSNVLRDTDGERFLN